MRNMEFAVIEIGGFQYIVSNGTTITVQGTVVPDTVPVLLYKNDDTFLLGNPYVTEININFDKNIQKKSTKTITSTFKAKSRHRSKKGSTHKIMQLTINSLQKHGTY